MHRFPPLLPPLRLLAAAALWMAAAAQAQDDGAALERGRRLFSGESPTSGRITGHTTALPPQASRCVNCHVAGSAGPAASSTSSFGPLLSASQLTRPIARRGGPPSRYDEASFCRLLSGGIDPAYVMIPRAMPRYEMPAADCHALWVYLSAAPEPERR